MRVRSEDELFARVDENVEIVGDDDHQQEDAADRDRERGAEDPNGRLQR